MINLLVVHIYMLLLKSETVMRNMLYYLKASFYYLKLKHLEIPVHKFMYLQDTFFQQGNAEQKECEAKFYKYQSTLPGCLVPPTVYEHFFALCTTF